MSFPFTVVTVSTVSVLPSGESVYFSIIVAGRGPAIFDSATSVPPFQDAFVRMGRPRKEVTDGLPSVLYASDARCSPRGLEVALVRVTFEPCWSMITR